MEKPCGWGAQMDLIEARRLASSSVQPLVVERVRTEDALGRVLAEKVIADRNLPGECRSRFDGYALRSTDTRGAAAESPVSLRIIPEQISAGHTPEHGLKPGESARIFTGAPLPPSSDAVAPQEEVVAGEEILNLRQEYPPGNGVVFSDDEVREGEFLLSEGAILSPVRLAFLAALGRDRVAVYRQPCVALVATGDEVKSLGYVEEGPYTICNNLHLLAWLTQLQGGRPSRLGVVRDNARLIADRLQSVAADLIITTGGMGKGDRDFILEAWKLLGVRVLFWGIKLNPGKHTALGLRGSQVFLGLSGNPWAAQIVFEELAVPMLRRWQGLCGLRGPRIAARLKTSLKHQPGFHKVVRGTLDRESALPSFTPVESRSASVFSRIRHGFAYIILEPHVLEVPEGTIVQVRLNDTPLLASAMIEGTGSGLIPGIISER
jgi:molybdopterin molybdotransferase